MYLVTDIWKQVLGAVDLRDIYHISRVCTEWRNAMNIVINLPNINIFVRQEPLNTYENDFLIRAVPKSIHLHGDKVDYYADPLPIILPDKVLRGIHTLQTRGDIRLACNVPTLTNLRRIKAEKLNSLLDFSLEDDEFYAQKLQCDRVKCANVVLWRELIWLLSNVKRLKIISDEHSYGLFYFGGPLNISPITEHLTVISMGIVNEIGNKIDCATLVIVDCTLDVFGSMSLLEHLTLYRVRGGDINVGALPSLRTITIVESDPRIFGMHSGVDIIREPSAEILRKLARMLPADISEESDDIYDIDNSE